MIKSRITLASDFCAGRMTMFIEAVFVEVMFIKAFFSGANFSNANNNQGLPCYRIKNTV
ncbi:hypothetical protein EGD00_18040 [Pectobacterium carotovorum subsp. carotovorum]|nr:hypothetical protein EGD00_18040 [Pectobacterium carotovorum subsp. carotovorum]